MNARAIRGILAASFVGCAATPPERVLVPAGVSASDEHDMGRALAGYRGLRVAMSAPSIAKYVPDALGVPGQAIRLELTNDGDRAVSLPELVVSLSSTRDGVVFPCARAVGRPSGVHERAVLESKQSVAIERSLDCSMPLPGRYDVRVALSLGGGTGDPVGSFVLNVESSRGEPQACPSRPGLYIAMAADRTSRPLPPASWARGDYHVVVAAINAGPRTVTVGPAEVAFLTYKSGSALACSGASEVAAFPDELAPGTMHVLKIPLTCAPTETGDYEVVGYVTLEGATRLEVGRLALRVTTVPTFYIPEPVFELELSPKLAP